MRDVPVVTHVEVIGDHLLRVTFRDGVRGRIDASGWEWNGVFAPLENPDFFARVAVDTESGTLVWPNGVDVAPEPLHAEAAAAAT